MAVNPFLAFSGATPMSDQMFGFLLMSTIVLTERASRDDAPGWLPALAGLLAASRT